MWGNLCNLWGFNHLPPHPHYRQHFQQALRESQDQGPDHQEEEDGWLVNG